jgi:hypothetical protein
LKAAYNASPESNQKAFVKYLDDFDRSKLGTEFATGDKDDFKMSLMDINNTRGILLFFRDLGFELDVDDLGPKNPKPDGYLKLGDS